MSLNAIVPATATLYARLDPQSCCYTDGGATTPAASNGDSLLSLKCPDTGKIFARFRTASLTSTWAVSGNLKTIRTVTTNTTTISGGAGFEYTSDTTFDPGNNTFFICLKPDRANKGLSEMILDIGNSLTASNNRITTDTSDYMATYNGAFASAGTPYLTTPSEYGLYCIRSTSAGTFIWRYGMVDNTNTVIKHSMGRTITSNPTATGFAIALQAAHTLFWQGNIAYVEAWQGSMTDGEVETRLQDFFDYLQNEIGFTILTSGNNDALIWNGDSRGAGIQCTLRSAELASLCKAGLVGTYPTLQCHNLSAATRQFTTIDNLTQWVINRIKATTGRTVYAVTCGTNDLMVVSAASLYTRITNHFTTIKAACPWVITILLEPGPRGDISGATLTNYEASRTTLAGLIDADPTFGGKVDYCFRTFNDTVMGASSTYTTPNATYVNSDKVHEKDAGQTRQYSGSDAAQTVQTIAGLAFGVAKRNHGRIAGGAMTQTGVTRGVERGVRV